MYFVTLERPSLTIIIEGLTKNQVLPNFHVEGWYRENGCAHTHTVVLQQRVDHLLMDISHKGQTLWAYHHGPLPGVLDAHATEILEDLAAQIILINRLNKVIWVRSRRS